MAGHKHSNRHHKKSDHTPNFRLDDECRLKYYRGDASKWKSKHYHENYDYTGIKLDGRQVIGHRHGPSKEKHLLSRKPIYGRYEVLLKFKDGSMKVVSIALWKKIKYQADRRLTDTYVQQCQVLMGLDSLAIGQDDISSTYAETGQSYATAASQPARTAPLPSITVSPPTVVAPSPAQTVVQSASGADSLTVARPSSQALANALSTIAGALTAYNIDEDSSDGGDSDSEVSDSEESDNGSSNRG